MDSNDMFNNIDGCMAQGVNEADVVLICLTKKYTEKVNSAALHCNSNDNCLKEWNSCFALQKAVLPVIMEPFMLRVSNWPWGVVPMRLAMHLYIDASDDEPAENAARRIDAYLKFQGFLPVAAPIRHIIRV